MDRETELRIVRRAYAKQVMAGFGVADRRIEAAFAAVPREAFLGPGPWPVMRWERYVATPSGNPVYLYADVVVGIIPERHLNNGQPSLHARLIASAAPKAGEHVVHIGAGVGYYTAILAKLAGRRGRITAIECDPGLAARLAANFAGSRTVRVVEGDGAQVDFAPADVVYVNAGATTLADPWLDRLAEGGRLIVPLTTNEGHRGNGGVALDRRGAVFRIERRGSEFLARGMCPVAFIPCESMRDQASEAALAAAFKTGGWRRVTRFYRREDVPEQDCWLRGAGWCLAYC